MSFAGKNGDYMGSSKQRLNLSEQAFATIQNDMFSFGEKSQPKFLNRIFTYYFPEAEASISRTLNRLSGELDMLFAEASVDNGTLSRITKRLVDRERKRLVKKATSYEKGVSILFSLNKENFSYLMEVESECSEERYYENRPSRYIKSVLEEYARLPYIQRERIYFSPFFEEIETAIREKWQLRVEAGNGFVYSVYPYAILSDPLSTANYLVGYSKLHSQPTDEERPCSFRISALRSIKAEKSKSAFLKEAKRKQIACTIAARGVQFMSSGEKKIYVRLTKDGYNNYKRWLHLRPALVRREGEDVFVFQCTFSQAKFYFFKFGKDAEILRPLDLRENFIKGYREALDMYLSAELGTLSGSDEQ